MSDIIKERKITLWVTNEEEVTAGTTWILHSMPGGMARANEALEIALTGGTMVGQVKYRHAKIIVSITCRLRHGDNVVDLPTGKRMRGRGKKTP